MGESSMSTILRLLRWIDRHVFGAWQCDVCGCTDHFACAGGCGWVPRLDDRHICTNCDGLELAQMYGVDVAHPARVALLGHDNFSEGETNG
jgi:hypothetical protein